MTHSLISRKRWYTLNHLLLLLVILTWTSIVDGCAFNVTWGYRDVEQRSGAIVRVSVDESVFSGLRSRSVEVHALFRQTMAEAREAQTDFNVCGKKTDFKYYDHYEVRSIDSDGEIEKFRCVTDLSPVEGGFIVEAVEVWSTKASERVAEIIPFSGNSNQPISCYNNDGTHSLIYPTTGQPSSRAKESSTINDYTSMHFSTDDQPTHTPTWVNIIIALMVVIMVALIVLVAVCSCLLKNRIKSRQTLHHPEIGVSQSTERIKLVGNTIQHSRSHKGDAELSSLMNFQSNDDCQGLMMTSTTAAFDSSTGYSGPGYFPVMRCQSPCLLNSTNGPLNYNSAFPDNDQFSGSSEDSDDNTEHYYTEIS